MRDPTLMKSLTNVKPVTSVSAKAGTLRIHERTHSGEKPHKCKTCDKCFSQAGTLRIRERTHSGEQPYKCKTRNKFFSQAGNFRTHERSHSGGKAYKCKAREKCFSSSGALDRHGRSHANYKPYKYELHMKKSGNPNTADKNNFSDNRVTSLPASSLPGPKPENVKVLSCWICQEEHASEFLLVKHYKDHMRDID